MSFQDQVVFITGGASGIGKAAAIAFAKAGAIVAFSDIQEEA
ncbi:MAG: SDR family NAD(P)-dependent oxidoreductase, partial [Bacteroidota bacterium]